MLHPVINRRFTPSAGHLMPTPSKMSQVPVNPLSRNSGTISVISERLLEVLQEAVSSRQGGTVTLDVRLVENGDIRDFELGFVPRTKTQ